MGHPVLPLVFVDTRAVQSLEEYFLNYLEGFPFLLKIENLAENYNQNKVLYSILNNSCL